MLLRQGQKGKQWAVLDDSLLLQARMKDWEAGAPADAALVGSDSDGGDMLDATIDNESD